MSNKESKVLLSDRQHETLKKAAAALGMPISTFLRVAGLEKAAAMGEVPHGR